MSKWNLIVDVEQCENCNNCFLAVADEYVGNEFPGYAAEMQKHGHRWIDIQRKERGQVPMVDVAYVPTMCNHCDDAPCMKQDTTGAISKRADGIVLIDPVKAKGHREIVDSCPYGAIWWNEESEVPQSWFFDAHLLDDGWKEPRCVQVCPTGALKSLKVEDNVMQKVVEDEGLEELRPDLATKPRVYYKNLYRYTKCFIGGSVAIEKDGVTDCLEDAKVTLTKDSSTVGEAATDNYGDFKFDRLDPDSGNYTIDITAPDGAKKSIDVELKESVFTGTIFFGRA